VNNFFERLNVKACNFIENKNIFNLLRKKKLYVCLQKTLYIYKDDKLINFYEEYLYSFEHFL
jgi:hypothetical protein